MSAKDRTAVIVGAARLPTGRFLGGLSSLRAPELGARAIAAAVERSGIDPEQIDEVIMGNVVQAGVGASAGAPGGHPGRRAAHGSRADDQQSVWVGSEGRHAGHAGHQGGGDYQVAVAGGMESMSHAPYLLRGYRDGVKFGNRSMVDALIHDGLWCSFGECHMGGHAEWTAWKAGVSREDQDQYALDSHMKAVRAIDGGEFAAEIVPVEVKKRREETVTISVDEPPRGDTTLEALAKLRPAFAGDAPPEVTDPSVTAGNAPGLNDGGAATVVTSEAFAEANGLDILARVTAYSVGATPPQELFFAPVVAVQRLMELEGTTVDDYDLIEANEAFAVQAIADARELGLDMDRLNVRGGAIALGHPIGASGAKILTTLLYALRDRDGQKGLATLCLGGGNAVALSVERV